MPSSISHSEKRLPRLAVLLALTAVMAMVLSAFYTLRGNPEIRHFVGTYEIKKAWSEKMTREHGAKVVVYGGSSCEFSIHGERLLEQHNLPCANLGRGAGMGALILTMAALDDVKEGDTLIVALEPALLTDALGMPNLGIQFSIASGNRHWIRQPLAPAESHCAVKTLLALRPGGLHTFTMFGKWIRGKSLYRYHLEDMHPSGYNETALRLEIDGPPGHGITVPEAVMEFLESLRDWCGERNVRVAYSLPWGYTPSDVLASTRRDNAEFLVQIAGILPVLKDSLLGADDVREHFADTAWHLTSEVAAIRTDQFAEQIQEWETWTVAELEELASR